MQDELKISVIGSSQRTLARRLFQLADDTGRVGLHREATMLATVAAYVLEGRPAAIRDA